MFAFINNCLQITTLQCKATETLYEVLLLLLCVCSGMFQPARGRDGEATQARLCWQGATDACVASCYSGGGLTPFNERRCPLLSCIGFLMPLRWFLYDWLCAVWLVDLAMATNLGTARGLRGRPRSRFGGHGPRDPCMFGWGRLSRTIRKRQGACRPGQEGGRKERL